MSIEEDIKLVCEALERGDEERAREFSLFSADNSAAFAALGRIERALKREQHVHAYWGMANCVTCGANRAPKEEA